jgi:hypothetical protein
VAFVYEVDLKGNIAAEAQKSAEAVKTLEGALKATTNALTKANALGDVGGHKKLTADSHMLTAALEQERSKLSGLTSQLPNVSSGLGEAAGGAEGLAGGLGAMAGPIGIAVAAGGTLIAVLGKIASAALDAAVSLTKFALEASDAQRTMLIQAEVLLGSAEAAAELDDQIDALAATGIASGDALTKMGTDLASAGLKGEKLKNALAGIADASAVMGESAGQAATNLFAKIEAGGGKAKVTAKTIASMKLEGALKPGIVTTDLLNEALNKKFAGGAQKMALGFKAQMAGLHEKIAQLFDGVNLEPFLNGLKTITALFDGNSASGKAMKAVITGAFDAIAKASAKVFPAIKTVLITVAIAALRVGIALKPLGKELTKLWDAMGGGDTAMSVLKLFTGLIENLAVGLAFTIGVVTQFVGAVNTFIDIASAGAEAASGLIDGLVSGISGGIAKAVQAAKDLANKVKGAIKGALGIASPSKVMLDIGHKGLGEGLAQGVERSIPRVSGATRALAGAAAGGAASAATGGSRGGGAVIHIGAINIDGAGASAQEITEIMVATTFERMALAQGLG